MEVELPNPEEIKEKRHDQFTKRVALSTAVIAVALAVTSVGGNNAAKEMMKEQMQASNQFSWYQAKSIREKLAQNESRKLKLEIARLTAAGGDSAATKDFLAKLEAEKKYFDGEAVRYGGEKGVILEKANENAAKSFEAQRQDGYFDLAEVLLQIGIVMASIAMLAVSRHAFIAAVSIAVLGALLSLNGFTLAIHVRFLEPKATAEEQSAAGESKEAGAGKSGHEGS